MSYDVIVVGARCAGGVLGTLLAKAGVKTLMLDADKLPSDMVMSTHFIQPPGMDVLDEIGLGEAVRKVTPASQVARFRIGRADVYPRFAEGRAGYCTRRLIVDQLVQEAATAAGAELRDQHRVVELVKEGERVAGVVVETPKGRETLRARLVVGADGRKSTIARLTGVEEYLRYPMTRGAYWFYSPMTDLWRNDPRYAYDLFIGWEGDGLRYIFQTSGDQLLVVAAPPAEEARRWGQDFRRHTMEYLAGSEVTAPLAETLQPMGKGVCFLKADFSYRRPVGPGFALVGDAGNFKDFVTGHGITDAFLGAKRLSQAILDGGEPAYQRFWRERDADTLPLYFDAIRLGEVGFNDPFAELLFERIAASPALSDRLTMVADRQISPFDLVPTSKLVSWVFGALLRGRFDVIKPFLKTGKRMGAFKKECSQRSALARAHN